MKKNNLMELMLFYKLKICGDKKIKKLQREEKSIIILYLEDRGDAEHKILEKIGKYLIQKIWKIYDFVGNNRKEGKWWKYLLRIKIYQKKKTGDNNIWAK